jgi:hypothetical protein
MNWKAYPENLKTNCVPGLWSGVISDGFSLYSSLQSQAIILVAKPVVLRKMFAHLLLTV